MSVLYNRIECLCIERRITVTTMCKESGASRASLSDLKMGRKQQLSADTLTKIANYFGVTVGYLLGEDTKKDPAETGEVKVTDKDIKFALFDGDEDIPEEAYEDVKRYAAFLKEKYKAKF